MDDSGMAADVTEKISFQRHETQHSRLPFPLTTPCQAILDLRL